MLRVSKKQEINSRSGFKVCCFVDSSSHPHCHYRSVSIAFLRNSLIVSHEKNILILTTFLSFLKKQKTKVKSYTSIDCISYNIMYILSTTLQRQILFAYKMANWLWSCLDLPSLSSGYFWLNMAIYSRNWYDVVSLPLSQQINRNIAI